MHFMNPETDTVSPVLKIKSLGFPWDTMDPFLFCAYHDDAYPEGNGQMGPRASLAGRQIGQDFSRKDGWSMYHGADVPGFPGHPHRGFETVTIVYEGIVAHRDSTGSSGVIGPGDVQWMTAASGIVHEEMHERAWAKKGGTLHAIQLWVNLPRAHKMSNPGYQTLLNEEIPAVELAGGAGRLRVIAGEFHGVKGPAKTFTPIHLYDLRVKAGHRTDVTVPAGFNTAVFVLQGEIAVNGSGQVKEAELARFDKTGERILIEAKTDATLLVLGGEPILEPIARYGPFVMNTQDELAQAVNDYRMGKMGHLG